MVRPWIQFYINFYIRLVKKIALVFHDRSPEVQIIQKPVYWFALQIKRLFSIWQGPPSWKCYMEVTLNITGNTLWLFEMLIRNENFLSVLWSKYTFSKICCNFFQNLFLILRENKTRILTELLGWRVLFSAEIEHANLIIH